MAAPVGKLEGGDNGVVGDVLEHDIVDDVFENFRCHVEEGDGAVAARGS